MTLQQFGAAPHAGLQLRHLTTAGSGLAARQPAHHFVLLPSLPIAVVLQTVMLYPPTAGPMEQLVLLMTYPPTAGPLEQLELLLTMLLLMKMLGAAPPWAVVAAEVAAVPPLVGLAPAGVPGAHANAASSSEIEGTRSEGPVSVAASESNPQ